MTLRARKYKGNALDKFLSVGSLLKKKKERGNARNIPTHTRPSPWTVLAKQVPVYEVGRGDMS